MHPDTVHSLIDAMRRQPRYRGLSVAQFFDHLPFHLHRHVPYLHAAPAPDWADAWRGKYQPSGEEEESHHERD